MNFYQDKQVKNYLCFLACFALCMLGIGLLFSTMQARDTQTFYSNHDAAVASFLLEQGISKEITAAALLNTEITGDGTALLAMAGIDGMSNIAPFLPGLVGRAIGACVCLAVVLFIGSTIFFSRRNRLYLQANAVIGDYINGDYSCHLPQSSEGAVYQLFSSVDQLATMLQAKSEAEHGSREFLKQSISDISHQLKTPLAALAMYQEIIAGEPDNLDTVQAFTAKMAISLKRMEQLIQSMLKITRLDAGAIMFERGIHPISDLITKSTCDLFPRAEQESKKIIIEGDTNQYLECDPEWTCEAISNIVKNALDHMTTGGTAKLSWERSPAMFRIIIADNGSGIAPEDIHHIFKRFYRSKHSLDTQGIGLGLPLAKSIIEGQGGIISVQSELGVGTRFTLSFLTEL